MYFSHDSLGAGVTLIDFHIRRCHSTVDRVDRLW